MGSEFKRTIAFIGGSGLAKGLDEILENVEPFKNEENKFGTVLSYYVGNSNDTRIIILPRHGDDSKETPSRSPSELVRQRGYEANIWKLHELGAEHVYGLSAVGVLDLETPLADAGSFIVPHTYMRGFAASQHTFGKDAIDIHPNMGNPFEQELRQKAIQSIQLAGYESRDGGIYIYNGGDQFESPAEIAVLNQLTQQFKPSDRLVGMTTVPELILLKQMNIPFAAICSNVNYAEGLSEETVVSHGQTIKIMETAAAYLTNVAKEIIKSYNKPSK